MFPRFQYRSDGEGRLRIFDFGDSTSITMTSELQAKHVCKAMNADTEGQKIELSRFDLKELLNHLWDQHPDQLITVIKKFRSVTGFGLKDSKLLAEAARDDRLHQRMNVDRYLDENFPSMG